jgi:hypothetical protein
LFTDIINTAVLSSDTIIPGGMIGGDAAVAVLVNGDLTSSGIAEFAVLNNDLNFLPQAGTIDGDAIVGVIAANITTGNFFQPLINNTEGVIGGDATIGVGVSGDVNVGTQTFFNLLNGDGTIGGEATSTLAANNFTSGDEFDFQIVNDGGTIGDDASLAAALAGSLSTNTDAFIQILDRGGVIGGSAIIDLSTSDLSAAGGLNFVIDNDEGSIGGSEVIALNTATLEANSLFATISNSGGSLGGNASITLNASGTVTTTGDSIVTVDLPSLGSEAAQKKLINAPRATGAIEFNGGTYEVGGTLLSTITGGDGGIALNAASMHADVLKVGAFGSNGSLTIGSGPLTGDTELKLYATGSNGLINFVSNVTLSSESSVIIAAKTVTINNGVVVTIAGDDGIDASVFTDVPNYTGSGGNGTTTGTFAGNGAETLPLEDAPPFDNVASAESDAPAPARNDRSARTGKTVANANGGGGSRHGVIARVADSNQLLALAEQVTSGEPANGGNSPRSVNRNARLGERNSAKRLLGHGPEMDRGNARILRGVNQRPAALP